MSTRTVTDRRGRHRCGAVLFCVVFSLVPRAVAAAPEVDRGESLVIARTEYRIDAAPGEIAWTATTALEISGPGRDHITASVPPDLQIVRVTGDGLASWKSASSRGRRPKQTLELHFRETVRGECRIVCTGLRKHSHDQPWSVPPLVLDEVDAHVGRARVLCAEPYELVLEDLDGARPVIEDAEKAGLVWDLWQENFRLEFTTRERDRSVRANVLTKLSLAQDRAELKAFAEIQPVRAPLFDLQLAIPAGWQVSEVRLDKQLVAWHRLSEYDGICDVRIPLADPISPGRAVRLELRGANRLPDASDSACEIALPEVRLPQATYVRGRYAIQRSGEFEMELSDLSGLREMPEHEFGDAKCYEHDARPIAGTLRIAARPVSAPEAPESPGEAPVEAVVDAELQPLPIPATVARRVRISSKLDPAGRALHRLDYVVTGELSSLLIRLPNSARLWRAIADEKPLPVVERGEALEVLLPEAMARRGERSVSILYHDEHPPLGTSGTLQLETVDVRAIDRFGHESPLEIVDQQWSIEPPRDVVLYESRGPFAPVHPLAATGWLAAAMRAVSSPARVLWAGLLLVAVIALARLRAPRPVWRAAAGAALVIATVGLLASTRPAVGGAAAPARSTDQRATAASAGTLFQTTLPAAGASLSLRYTTQVHSATSRCAAAACAVFVLWLLRRRGSTFRTVLAVAGVALPVAALPSVDAAYHVWLDGIVLGTLAAAVLWQVRPPIAPQITAGPVLARSAAALLVFTATAGSAHGEGPSPVMLADSTSTVRLADEGAHLRCRYDLQVLSGSPAELSFTLPDEVKVRTVTGANVAGWHSEHDANPGRLVVRFSDDVNKTASLTVELFHPMTFGEGTTTWELPALDPLYLTSHRGTLSVVPAEYLEAEVASAQGLRRIDPVAGKAPADGPALAWARTGGDIALTLNVARPHLSCDVLAVYSAVIEPERLRLSSRFRLTHRGDASLRFTAFVPEGYRPVEARAPHLARWSLDEGLLTVWFERPQGGSIDVELDLEAPHHSDGRNVEIAVPLPLDAARVRSVLGVWVDGTLEPAVDAGALSGWNAAGDPIASAELPERDGEPPLLLLANDSPEPLPVLVGVTPRAAAVGDESAAAVDETDAEQKNPEQRATPEAFVDTAHLSLALRGDGVFGIEARYRVQGRSRRFLPVLLPEGMRLLAADVDGEPVVPSRAEADAAPILIPLPDRVSSAADVSLLLAAQVPGGLAAEPGFFSRRRIVVPPPQIPTAEADPQYGLPVVRTLWNVSVPSALRATLAGNAAAATLLTSDGNELVIEQSGPPADLRLTTGPASPTGPVSLIAAAVLAAGLWTTVRRRSPASLPAVGPQPPPPEPPAIAALPHESGIFSQPRRGASRRERR